MPDTPDKLAVLNVWDWSVMILRTEKELREMYGHKFVEKFLWWMRGQRIVRQGDEILYSDAQVEDFREGNYDIER